MMFTPIITLTQYEYGAVQIGSGQWYVLPVDPANLHKSYIHTVVTLLGVRLTVHSQCTVSVPTHSESYCYTNSVLVQLSKSPGAPSRCRTIKG